MANSKRRAEYTDRNGAMFIPMNVEGGTWNEHFITTPKLICIVLIIFSFVLILLTLNSDQAPFLRYVIFFGIWGFISLQVMRFIVFEEKFYYKMYQELKIHEISSPALFWDIASIKDTDDGAIITYSDARIAILVRIERDTITGKQKEFKETHYDAISDFYREVATNRYSFVQMNIMEQAGKDPRLNELSKVVYKSDNANICKLMEMQVGHIKNITHKSLYESDYFLFYTQDLSKVDNIIQDITECIFKLLDGAYISYQILTSREIVDLVKEIYGVNYFNSTEASLMMFDKQAAGSIIPFTLTGILWKDGENQELNSREINKLRNTTSSVIAGTIQKKDLSLKETFYRKNTKNKVGIDFNELSEMPVNRAQMQRNQRRQHPNNQHSNPARANLAKQNIVQNNMQNMNNTRNNVNVQNKVNLNKPEQVQTNQQNEGLQEEEEYIDI
jgi:hypothetical protein